MSLDPNKLYNEFLRWFRSPGGIKTAEQSEARLARVYHSYAMDGEDVSGENPDNLDVLKFERPLSFRRSKTERQFAQQIDSAFVAYWTGTTFPILVVPPVSPPCPNVGGTGAFASETTSVVSAVAAGAMYTAILPIIRGSRATAEQSARRLAAAMDSVTKSAVTVLITGVDTTSPTPVTITNTCTVF